MFPGIPVASSSQVRKVKPAPPADPRPSPLAVFLKKSARCVYPLPACLSGAKESGELKSDYQNLWEGFDAFCHDLHRLNNPRKRLLLINGVPLCEAQRKAISQLYSILAKGENPEALLRKNIEGLSRLLTASMAEDKLRTVSLPTLQDEELALYTIAEALTIKGMEQLFWTYHQNTSSTASMWLTHCTDELHESTPERQFVHGVPPTSVTVTQVEFDRSTQALHVILVADDFRWRFENMSGEVDKNGIGFPGNPAIRVDFILKPEELKFSTTAKTDHSALARGFLMFFLKKRHAQFVSSPWGSGDIVHEQIAVHRHIRSCVSAYLQMIKTLPSGDEELRALLTELSHIGNDSALVDHFFIKRDQSSLAAISSAAMRAPQALLCSQRSVAREGDVESSSETPEI